MEKLLKLEVIDNWMNEAEGLGFMEQRCDEFAKWIMEQYCSGGRQEVAPIAEFIAHFIWEKGDKKLKPWEVYAIWHTLDAEEDRIVELVSSTEEQVEEEVYDGAFQKGYAAAYQEAYNHGLEEGYANGFYDGEHSERE